MTFDPLDALAVEELGVSPFWLTGELERRGLAAETVAVEIQDGPRDVADVRALLLDGPHTDTTTDDVDTDASGDAAGSREVSRA